MTAITRSFFLTFIGDDDELVEIELAVLLEENYVINPSTLAATSFDELLQSYHITISDRIKARLHCILTHVSPCIKLPPLQYWVATHQLVIFRDDEFHHERYPSSIWETESLLFKLDFHGDVYGQHCETDIWLEYTGLTNATTLSTTNRNNTPTIIPPITEIPTPSHGTSDLTNVDQKICLLEKPVIHPTLTNINVNTISYIASCSDALALQEREHIHGVTGKVVSSAAYCNEELPRQLEESVINHMALNPADETIMLFNTTQRLGVPLWESYDCHYSTSHGHWRR